MNNARHNTVRNVPLKIQNARSAMITMVLTPVEPVSTVWILSVKDVAKITKSVTAAFKNTGSIKMGNVSDVRIPSVLYAHKILLFALCVIWVSDSSEAHALSAMKKAHPIVMGLQLVFHVSMGMGLSEESSVIASLAQTKIVSVVPI